MCILLAIVILYSFCSLLYASLFFAGTLSRSLETLLLHLHTLLTSLRCPYCTCSPHSELGCCRPPSPRTRMGLNTSSSNQAALLIVTELAQSPEQFVASVNITQPNRTESNRASTARWVGPARHVWVRFGQHSLHTSEPNHGGWYGYIC